MMAFVVFIITILIMIEYDDGDTSAPYVEIAMTATATICDVAQRRKCNGCSFSSFYYYLLDAISGSVGQWVMYSDFGDS